MSARHVLGSTRLALDAAREVASIVETMHLTIASAPPPLAPPLEGATHGITGGVYASIRLAMDGIRDILDLADAKLALLPGAVNRGDPPARLAWQAALNGVVGDHLAASANPLALRMTLRHGSAPLPAAGLPGCRRALLLVHGLCMNDLQWRQGSYCHADRLAREHGAQVVALRYNSGRHISQNGAELAALLEAFLGVDDGPERLDVLAHSMGGLVVRSALHQALQLGHRWPRRFGCLIFLGTPHHGAPLERHGHRLHSLSARTAYTAPLSRLGRLRSAGVTDLRHAFLLDTDWVGRDRFDARARPATPVPLPVGIAAYAAAASLGRARGDLRDRMLGDGLVPVGSALGEHPHPDHDLGLGPARQALFLEADHWDLLRRPDIGDQLARWLAGAS